MGKFTDKDQFRRILSLAIMIFSGVGFRVFQFSASLLVWMAIIFILNYKTVSRIPFRAWSRTALLLAILILVFIFKGAQLPYFVFVAILTALFGLSNYFNNKNLFFGDFSKLLQFYMYYTLIAIPILLFGNSFLNEVWLAGDMRYYTFYWLFWFNDNGGPSFFHGYRFTGLTWEVGIWQLFLNLNFLFALYENRSIKKIFLSILAVISLFSTMGIILVGFVYLLYILLLTDKANKAKMLIPIVFFAVSFPLMQDNVEDKLNGKHSGSGMIRVADFYSGVSILMDYPIFGVDPDLANGSNNSLVARIKEKYWTSEYIDESFDGFMKMGNNNGIIIFLLDWGLPLGLFLLVHSARSNLFTDKKLNIVLMSTIYFSMFSEAISRTSFFYFFILSSFLIPTYLQQKKNHG